MKRREFIALLGGGAAAWPFAARAQQPVPVIGWLSGRSAAADAQVLPAFRKALNAHGFVEGRNVSVEYRNADLQLDRLPALAADLVRRAAVIVAVGSGTVVARAVQAENAAVPMVIIFGADPLQSGIVRSINRPGGNVTGVTNFHPQLVQKRFGLLHDLLPRARLVAVLANPAEEEIEQQTADVRDAARVLGLETKFVNAGSEGDIYAAFTSLAQIRPDALFVASSPLFFTYSDRIVALATHLALPTSFHRREFVVAGGLMSYASTTEEVYRVLGDYAGRILKGEKAGELPIWQPTKLELVLNLKTAKALGLTVPTSMLLLADEVIE
jgi:putative ABC transport system substrate-binding protein